MSSLLCIRGRLLGVLLVLTVVPAVTLAGRENFHLVILSHSALKEYQAGKELLCDYLFRTSDGGGGDYSSSQGLNQLYGMIWSKPGRPFNQIVETIDGLASADSPSSCRRQSSIGRLYVDLSIACPVSDEVGTRLLEVAANCQPCDYVTVSRAASLLRRMDESEAAIELLSHTIRCEALEAQEARIARLYLLRAKVHADEERFDASIRDLDRSVASRPMAEAYYMLGRIYWNGMQDPDAALESFEDAWRLDARPRYLYAHSAVALAVGDTDLAIEDLEVLVFEHSCSHHRDDENCTTIQRLAKKRLEELADR